MKKILVILIAIFLVGCGAKDTKDVKEEVEKVSYEGLSAEETYKKAITYANENITHYKETMTRSVRGSSNDMETSGDFEILVKEDKLYSISKEEVQNGNLESYYIRNDDIFYKLYLENEKYVYEEEPVSEEFLKDVQFETFPSTLIEDRKEDLITAEREDKTNQIVLTFVFKTDDDIEESFEFVIGEDGYIIKVTMETIVSESKFVLVKQVYNVQEVNKKEEIDIDEAITELKDLRDTLVE